MRVSTLCQKLVFTVRKSDGLIEAARLMREKHIGYLIVVKQSLNDGLLRPVGVLSDRDIVVGVIAQDADPHGLTVGDIMSAPPVCIRDDEPVDKAVEEMRRVGVRRIPVVGSSGELVGVLALDDVLEALAGELQTLSLATRRGRAKEGEQRR